MTVFVNENVSRVTGVDSALMATNNPAFRGVDGVRCWSAAGLRVNFLDENIHTLVDRGRPHLVGECCVEFADAADEGSADARWRFVVQKSFTVHCEHAREMCNCGTNRQLLGGWGVGSSHDAIIAPNEGESNRISNNSTINMLRAC